MCLPRIIVFIEIVFIENQEVFRWPVDVAEGAQIFLPPLTRVIAPS